MWLPPVRNKKWRLTNDKMSFEQAVEYLEIPLAPHVGAFGVERKHHFHEGVDIYVPHGTPVHAVENGVVVAIEQFTGEHAQSPWWHNTWAVLVEGSSGVVVYGEIETPLEVGQSIQAGDHIGVVIPVLKTAKGRPDCMLHLELHEKGTRATLAWEEERPSSLLDPTPLCLDFLPRHHTIKEMI